MSSKIHGSSLKYGLDIVIKVVWWHQTDRPAGGWISYGCLAVKPFKIKYTVDYIHHDDTWCAFSCQILDK